MNKFAYGFTALALVMAAPGYVSAQAETEQPAQTQAQQPDQQAQQFVEQAAYGGMFEIQSSQQAVEKAQNQEVISFAERMIQDHTAANEELKQIAEAKGIQVPTALDQKHQQMVDQVAQASGADFDRQYMQAQVMGHQETVDLFRQNAEQLQDQELKTFAQSTLPALEEHLTMAQQLQQQVNAGGNVAAVTPGAASGTTQEPPAAGTADTTAAAGAAAVGAAAAGTAAAGNAAADTAAAGTTAAGDAAADTVAAATGNAAQPGEMQDPNTVAMEDFIGRTVVGSDGQELGDISDIILDPQTGQAQQLVISSGGFLGIGEKEIAIDFAEAQIQPDQNVVQVSSMTQADVENMEEFVRSDEMTTYTGMQPAGQDPAAQQTDTQSQ